jgi:hypothetical protein
MAKVLLKVSEPLRDARDIFFRRRQAGMSHAASPGGGQAGASVAVVGTASPRPARRPALPSVHHMILPLDRAGLIRRQPGLPRSMEVLVSPEDLPVLQTRIQPVKTSVQKYPG